MSAEATPFKPKKSVALSGTIAGNTALCTVGRTGNDLHYRGYDILDIAETCEFEEIAYLLIHGKLPNVAELAGYKTKLKSLRGLPAALKASGMAFETPIPTAAKPAIAIRGSRTNIAISMPIPATSPPRRTTLAGLKRATSQSPEKRPIIMAMEKAARPRVAMYSGAPSESFR